MASENKIRRIAVWVVSVPLTVVFLIAGVMKLLGKAAGMFEHWGYPAWFSYAVGAVEVVSSRSAPDSEGRIPRRCCIGSGHGRSHFHPYPGQRMEPRPVVVVLLVLAAIIAYARREQLLGASSGAASDLKPRL